MAVYLIFSEPILALFGAANESAYYTDFTVKCFRMYLCLMPLATLNKGTFISVSYTHLTLPTILRV